MRGKLSVTFRPRSRPRPSLRGRRSKGKGIRAQDRARGRKRTPRALPRVRIPTCPSPFNAYHASYPRPRIQCSLMSLDLLTITGVFQSPV